MTKELRRKLELILYVTGIVLTLVWGYVEYIALPQAVAVNNARIMMESYNANHVTHEHWQITGE